ncbi:MAG TPA: PglZ domain-containing protein, partial [Verrucomicrobiae bacterium]|nr:PglZ domain-containing protein [Verrucomicrobiae bacterium]
MNKLFQEFLRDRWREKLEDQRVLSIYDPSGVYEEIANTLAGPHANVLVVGPDIITAREEALESFRKLAADATGGSALVLYHKRARPVQDAEWLDDPFAPLALAGGIFPDGPADDYKSLCQQFLPERTSELDELFGGGEPSLAVINQLVEGAASYPTLNEVCGAEGPREILVCFLCMSAEQRKKFGKAKVWKKELETLAKRTLDFSLSAKGVDPDEVRLALWRYMLFSEFAADLPGALPAALEDVPRASKRHHAFVYSVCDKLRDSKTAEQDYEDFAARVADQLKLESHCRSIEDLGERDTFAFEERTFLRRFAKLALHGDADAAAAVAAVRQRSFWIRDPRRAAEWKLAGCCLEFLRRLDMASGELNLGKDRTPAEWARFHAEQFAPVDALYRQVEEVVDELMPIEGPLIDVVAHVRERYVEAVDKQARLFQAAVQQEGWPTSGLIRANEIFTQCVLKPWQDSKRVAFFWVDAFRFDLGLLLRDLAGGRHGVTVAPACAQLPTFTAVGMAALLPGAETGLRLAKTSGGLAVTVNGQTVGNPDQRFQLIQRLVGHDRTRMVDLDDLVGAKTMTGAEKVEMLVVKTCDIDQLGEANPSYVIRLIPEIVRKVQLALNRLADAGFNQAVLVGDHGFHWFAAVGSGDAVAK